jgi:DNA-binding MarR family transcriptional regulator
VNRDRSGHHGGLHDARPGPSNLSALEVRLAGRVLGWAGDTGLAVAELRLLLALADAGPLSGGQAAVAAGLSPDAGYGAVEGLRRRDLVAEDRRRYRLTGEGTALVDRMHATRRAGVRAFLDGLAPAEQATVAALASDGLVAARPEEATPRRSAGGRIVVGVDDSAPARAALRWAATESAVRGAVLHAVHAWRRPGVGVGIGMPAGGVLPVDADREHLAATQLLTDIVRDELGGIEPPARRSVGRGEPAQVLLDAAPRR